ncbi:myotubularin-like protein [Phytophthora infestans T30-4]|uniref:phosphatidylinositol-3,5-bisphosphate 3-phosphatase n=1 Tax=Phytophthora infestans (strain T30-4) TaxID=403677 RepID=D0NRZ1_PHYIT|nr:myotubularin-like protein [Phytophthora infestans T30-4]EEY63532.1 myotubularin-like protein [Phytophthora infestans T30-4]|eukprot:XP_002898119.1 myotubularin-like protein [Phytophthora infestans T30-4]
MLRRHHCRRCGNVFCDACSSARMPLVNSGFVTPVRVCAKCSVAAKKAHAKMVQERHKARTYQPLRRHSDTGEGSAMEGDIITSNGRRQMPMSPVFTRGVSSDSYERNGSEDADYASGQNDGYLQILPGEAVLVRNDNVRVRFLERIEHTGRLYVTNYRLVFSPTVDSEADELPYASDLQTESLVAYQAIPMVTIERVKRKEMVETDSGLLEVVGKDFRRVQFIFEGLVSKQTFSQFDRTFALVRTHALGEPEGKVDEFAKFSIERFDGVNGAVDGWRIYDAVAEFRRLGISSSTSRWRLSYVNEQYELCPTYPSILAVPASVSNSVLAVASKFRSKGRIPVLSWRDRHTGAVICRSSQPLVGLGQKQCDKDVFLIQAIAATNPSSTKLVIIDARPWKNAVAQKTVGRAGYELTEHYETRHATASMKYADMVASEHNAAAAAVSGASINGEVPRVNEASTGNGWDDDGGPRQFLETMESALVLTECKLIFMGIENIHTMRKSYHKLMDLCTTKQNNDRWLDQLASTRWLDHISRILDSAVEIVRIVKEQKSSVLIHCSDGWDRTAQLTALAELMIDPYYRTIVGFERLIEKEWCSFGHKFRDRTSHGASNNINETSPVFLQWIDCVWQVMAQFPSAFEFNERYLILILDHLYSCRFGTFLYNSQRERMEQESLHPTQSLWSYLSTVDRAVVINPFYQPQNAPRTKWKTNVTATRQCFERSIGQSYEESPRLVPHMTQEDCEVHSLAEDYLDYGRNAFDASDGSSACSSSSSMVCGSTVAVASSPSKSRADATDVEVKAALQSTHDQLTRERQRRRIDSSDSLVGDEFDSWDGESEENMMILQPSCYHRLVRDLDTGFSFPQALETSIFSNFPSSPAVAPRSRSFFSRRYAEDDAAARLSTPKSRTSLTSLFMPVERAPLSDGLWNASEADAVSEEDEVGRYGALAPCEDVIVPSCAMKSLKFWTHYYLRWDPSSHFERDASVEIEALHLDLLKRLETLAKQVDTIQGGEASKWENKRQSQGLPEGNLSPMKEPPRRERRAKSEGSTLRC